VLCLSLDVTNEQQAHSAAQEAIKYFGQIDVLVRVEQKNAFVGAESRR
jgi:NADP-dependent 3-hydroxy acid dehydrogenase YdfG